jgi:hypothetical protein
VKANKKDSAELHEHATWCAASVVYKLRGLSETEVASRVSNVTELFGYVVWYSLREILINGYWSSESLKISESFIYDARDNLKYINGGTRMLTRSTLLVSRPNSTVSYKGLG